jgi:UDP-N-acetylglucosamine--N-acetylmuramyl-(pentapeptide) pyrophosphoryl-undecaprenol N-acetylglucosamine transferase
MKILLTGGGTAGHLVPLLAITSELRKLETEKKIEKLEFLLLTPDSEFNKSISDAGIQVKIIKAGKLRRYFSLENLIDIFKIPVGAIQSLYYVRQFKPDIVFSKGGFASVPPIIAAWILRVPIVTHESDIVPGLANRIISRFASKILISFSVTERYFDKNKVILTGNPIRSDIAKGNTENALKFFKLSPDLPTVLIFGGSQGAQKINEIILEILPDLIEKYQVIHICGDKNYKEMKLANYIETGVHSLECKDFNSGETNSYRLKPELQNRYKLYPYLNKEMRDAYALADVIIARAGANSLFEIIALKKPSIIIPLPTSANNHQFQNAEFFAKNGIITLVKEENLTKDVLMKELSKILQKNDFRANMIRKMDEYNSGRKNAAKITAEEIINCIGI